MLGLVNEEDIEAVVEEEFKRLIDYYYKILRRTVVGHIMGSANDFYSKIKIRPEITVNEEVLPFMDSYEYVFTVRVRIPEREQKKIKEILRKKLIENRGLVSIRIKALYNIIRNELEAATGELGALLPDMHSGSPEGADKAGRGRKEVRPEEGGHPPEGIVQGFGGGNEVEGEEE